MSTNKSSLNGLRFVLKILYTVNANTPTHETSAAKLKMNIVTGLFVDTIENIGDVE